MVSPPNPEGPYAVNEGGAGSEEPGVRRGFVQRVFIFVGLKLVFTALFIAAGTYQKADRKKFEEKKNAEVGLWLWLSIPMLCLIYWRLARRAFIGIICLILLFLFLSAMAVLILVQCSTWAILFAVSSTAILTLVFVCVHACTNFDITKYRVFVRIFLWIGIGCVVILGIVKFQKPDVRAIELTVGAIGSLVFSVWLLYVVQTIMGGRAIAVKPDQRIYGTAQLYLAIMLTCNYLMMLNFL